MASARAARRRDPAEEAMSLVVVRRRAGECYHRTRAWFEMEWTRSRECRGCGKSVGMLDRVCNQCGTSDPAQVSRPLVAVLAGVGVPLILILLLVAA
jgi:hypothetical protein